MNDTTDMDEDSPPLPPPPPMTPEQRKMAEEAIRAAIAREAECRHEEEPICEENVQAPDIVFKAVCCALAAPTTTFDDAEDFDEEPKYGFVRPARHKSPRLTVELPENKPRKPDLHSANLSFAARVIIWVRDRYDNNAPAIYKAAYLSRKTYSAIISDENHVVSKRTAIQLAFALRLSREEADLLLHAAGYHLSRSVIEDIIFDACLEAKIHSLEDVNQLLVAHECRPFVPQA